METIQRADERRPGEEAAAPASPGLAAAQVRVAYLLSQYPAVSHTFFLHEVQGLRARGMDIATASINQPDRPVESLPANEALEAASTEYIKSKDRAGMLLAVAGVCMKHPMVLLRGLGAVLRMPRLTLLQRGFWLFYLLEAMLVGRWMRRHQMKHLHVHFGGPVASVGMLTSAAWGVPWSLTIHGPEELLNFDAYHLREKLASASFVFCISDFCRSQLCQLAAPETWDKFQVVRLGVDPLLLSPATRPPAVVPRLVCIGRLVPAKGHRILLEALWLLRDRGVKVQVTLIGGGPELAALERFVAAHGLTDRVTFTSSLPHDASLSLLREADLFALASFAEGIPVALMEAMALGVACVSTTIAGIPELITNGVDGLLVAPGNAEALAEALQTLIADPAYRQQLGAAGRRKVLREYNLPLNHALLAASFAKRMQPGAGRTAA